MKSERQITMIAFMQAELPHALPRDRLDLSPLPAA